MYGGSVFDSSFGAGAPMVDPQARMPLGAGCSIKKQGVLARRPLEPLLRSAGPPAGFPHQGDPDGGMAGDGAKDIATARSGRSATIEIRICTDPLEESRKMSIGPFAAIQRSPSARKSHCRCGSHEWSLQ